MTSIRQSNRACKSRDYWDFTNSTSHQRQSSVFIIYIESLKDLDFELFDKDLDLELFDKDLDFEFFDENLSSKLSKKDLSFELDKNLSKYLSRQLHENLNISLKWWRLHFFN